MKKINLSKITHKGDDRIKVAFDYDTATIATVKQIEGSKWSQSKKCWHLPYTKEAFAALQSVFGDSLKIENKYIDTKKEAVKEENVSFALQRIKSLLVSKIINAKMTRACPLFRP